MTAPGDGLLGTLEPAPADPLLGLIEEFARDPRRDKVDLGVGVLRDAKGATPRFRAVKAAEAALLAEQETKA